MRTSRIRGKVGRDLNRSVDFTILLTGVKLDL